MLSHEDFAIGALLEEGTLDRAAVDRANAYALEKSVAIGEAIVALGMMSSRDLALVQAETSEYPYADLGAFDVNFKNSALLGRATVESLTAFPLFVIDDVATVGMANPLDLKGVDQLRSLLKMEIDPVLCEPGALRALIDRAYALSGDRGAGEHAGPDELAGERGNEKGSSARLTSGQEPMVAAVNQIIAQGVELGASDIHLGPDEHELHLRYRVDGALRPHQGPGLAAHSGLVQRLKVMAHMDLTQTRRPQDGKFRFVHQGRPVDIRASVIPTVCGENAVLRLLATGANIKGFPELGVSAEEIAHIEAAIEQPYGMVLVTGPTGSGKTTTLYTALKRLNCPDLNIMTIEDPVEIRLPLIRQVQVNSEIGMTFASALRSILRQDPDVVFVGEIRDEETARISVQAALTGHLVLSSLHTNDAAGAIPRLRDLGCPSFAINAAVLCVIAQRLVRRVCADCAQGLEPDALMAARFGITGNSDGKFVRGAGCGRCGNSGYRGRMGVYEVLRMTREIQRAVEAGESAVRLAALAERAGMRPMWRDGLAKARVGLTTLEELVRIVAVQGTEPDAGETARAAAAAAGSEARMAA